MLEELRILKAVLITGTSSGIGRSCAIALDQLGFQVFAGVRNPEDGKALTELTSERCTPLILDVTNQEAIAAAKATVTTSVGDRGLFALVNNAAINVDIPLEFIPISDLRTHLEVNLIGAVAMTQAFLPLIRSASGRIINIGSTAGRFAFPFSGAYCASKAALEMITTTLRQELQPWGIAVIMIELGGVNTPIWHKSLGVAEDLAQTSPEFSQLYGASFAKFKNLKAQVATINNSPEQATQAILPAITSATPENYYLVGQDAYWMSLLSLLPQPIKSWLNSQIFSFGH